MIEWECKLCGEKFKSSDTQYQSIHLQRHLLKHLGDLIRITNVTDDDTEQEKEQKTIKKEKVTTKPKKPKTIKNKKIKK